MILDTKYDRFLITQFDRLAISATQYILGKSGLANDFLGSQSFTLFTGKKTCLLNLQSQRLSGSIEAARVFKGLFGKLLSLIIKTGFCGVALG